jgi:hypothetical protein
LKQAGNWKLERIHIDLLPECVNSFEGYEYAMVITNDATMYLWVYGLKTTDNSNAMLGDGLAISPISAKYVLQSAPYSDGNS